ncbi:MULTISPECIES: DinB family protein [unclassified Nocardioides]|uniref:DinB family protein n=1 Tax=unclassified Nocardioides TaxID=2615069 RepID=UPI003616410B
MTPASIADEIRAARADFRRLVDGATTAELRGRTDGTRWTNDQLLFHMLFGYLLVRTLLWVVRGFARLPDAYSRLFAAGLNAASRPFHVVNYLGSLGGARILGHAGMERVMDHVSDDLVRTLERSSENQLARGMHFPVGWDPYFRDFMTIQDVLHYATQHYQHHRRQLTLGNAHHS